MSATKPAGPTLPLPAQSGDPIPTDRGRRYYRWTDPDTGEVGGHECLSPGGQFPQRRGKNVRWTDVGGCPNAPQRTPGEE